MTTTSEPSPSDAAPLPLDRPTRLPSLFATDTQLFGWQGLTATLPADWNLASFGGSGKQGQLRIDDEEGPRLELRWENPTGQVDLEKSLEKFLQTLAKDAKKRGVEFEKDEKAIILDNKRKNKDKLFNFAWTGDRHESVAHGCGVAWQCSDCGRVVVGHLMGRGTERVEKVRKLATQIFTSLECHGTGGWQTWSLFECRMEIPEEFELTRAKLMTGRIDLEWTRPRKPGPLASFQRDERLTFARWALAGVLLQHRTLTEWADRNADRLDKNWNFSKWEEVEHDGKPGLKAEGVLSDVRLRVRRWLFDLVLRRRTRGAEIVVWHNEADNKLMAFASDLKPANLHVRDDVLDSLDCH